MESLAGSFLVHRLPKEEKEPLACQTDLLKNAADEADPLLGAEVTVHGSAFADGAADDADGVAAVLESFDEIPGVHLAQTGKLLDKSRVRQAELLEPGASEGACKGVATDENSDLYRFLFGQRFSSFLKVPQFVLESV